MADKKKDDETGITPVSTDAEGATADELAARRKNGGSAKDRAALKAEQDALDVEDGKAPGSEDEEDDGQGFFVWERGTKVTLATLVKRGTPVEHHFVFGGRRSKGQGGLMGFEDKPLMIVRGKPGAVKIVPTYDKDENVSKVAIENHVDAVIVKPADSQEGLDLIAHILDEKGWTAPKAAA